MHEYNIDDYVIVICEIYNHCGCVGKVIELLDDGWVRVRFEDSRICVYPECDVRRVEIDSMSEYPADPVVEISESNLMEVLDA